MKETSDLYSYDYRDIDEWTSVLVGDKIAFIKISQDETPWCPIGQMQRNGKIKDADFSGNGVLFSFDSQADADEGSRLVKESKAIPLSCFRHSGETWGIMGTLDHYPDAQWDLTRYAGVWIPDEEVMANIRAQKRIKGKKQADKLREYCEGVIKQLNQWCHGDVYGYRIRMYTAMYKDDGSDEISMSLVDDIEYYDENHSIHVEDSCWGFYGTESVEEAVNEYLAYELTSSKQPDTVLV